MQELDDSALDFEGDFVHGIDASRRVMFPAKWRPKDKQMIFRAILWPLFGPGQYLLVLPPQRWRVMVAKLQTRSLLDERVAAMERRIGATSTRLELDRVGRFFLPENLAQAAGLDKEAKFVGRVDKFEIWSPERYQAALVTNDELVASLAKEMAKEIDKPLDL